MPTHAHTHTHAHARAHTQTQTHTHTYTHGGWFAVACKALFCSFPPAQLVRLEALCRAVAKTRYI